MYENMALFALMALLYAAFSRFIERSWVTGPIVFVGAGLLIGPFVFGLINFDVQSEGIKELAEFTLALVLFNDAGGSDLRRLRQIRMVPIRMLTIALPLCIALGYLFGWLLLPGLEWVEIALLATLLAPTDAALGSAVVNNEAVPPTIRASLSTESGLNDGLAVPFLLFFVEILRGEAAHRPFALIGAFIIEEVGIGVLVGAGLVSFAAVLLRFTAARKWIARSWLPVPVMALGIGCFAIAQSLGGSGFIASFTGGLTFSYFAKEHKHQLLAASESVGEILAMLTWMVFGALVVPVVVPWITPMVLLYAVLSLTIVRMLPVSVSLIGSGVNRPGRLFMGWFGPRGLASIVFVVLVLSERLVHPGYLAVAAVTTIVLSILAHGISANYLATTVGPRLAIRTTSDVVE